LHWEEYRTSAADNNTYGFKVTDSLSGITLTVSGRFSNVQITRVIAKIRRGMEYELLLAIQEWRRKTIGSEKGNSAM